jgi:hypothetical protein
MFSFISLISSTTIAISFACVITGVFDNGPQHHILNHTIPTPTQHIKIHPTGTIHHHNSMYSSGKRIVSNSHSRSTKIVSYVSSTNPGAGTGYGVELTRRRTAPQLQILNPDQ